MKLLLRNRKGQGTTEYIAIIAVALIALMAFWPTIKHALQTKTGEIVNNIGAAGNN